MRLMDDYEEHDPTMMLAETMPNLQRNSPKMMAIVMRMALPALPYPSASSLTLPVKTCSPYPTQHVLQASMMRIRASDDVEDTGRCDAQETHRRPTISHAMV